MDKEKKSMSHIRNVLMAVEEKGYNVSSIGYNGTGRQIEVIVDEPAYAGNRAFLDKARSEAESETVNK
jgi:hypothetical protein